MSRASVAAPGYYRVLIPSQSSNPLLFIRRKGDNEAGLRHRLATSAVMLCLAGSLSTGFLVAPTHLRSAATLRRAPAVELNLRNYVVMAAQAAAKQAAAEEADVVANAEARRFDAVPRVYDAAVAISAAMEAGKLKDAAAIQAAAVWTLCAAA